MEQIKCRFQFLIRLTEFCNHIILMYEISVMLIFNNHLGNQPMEKIDESNDTEEAKDILSCFKWTERSRKSVF